MNPVLFSLSASPDMAAHLCAETGMELGEIVWRQFPDGESYVRLLSSVRERDVVLLCTLARQLRCAVEVWILVARCLHLRSQT